MARVRKNPAVRRGEILDAAMGLFTRKGFINVSVADIAREAGIARTTIYEYYIDKTRILIDLADRVAAKFAYTVPEGDTAYAKLLSVARGQLRRIDDDRPVYCLLFREAPVLSDAFADNMKRWRRAGYDTALALMREARDAGEIRPEVSAEDAVFAFLSLIGQRAGDVLMSGEAIDADAEAKRLLDLAWHGISAG